MVCNKTCHGLKAVRTTPRSWRPRAIRGKESAGKFGEYFGIESKRGAFAFYFIFIKMICL